MRRLLLSSLFVLVLGIVTYSASGTPNNLIVRTDANNYLLVTSVTQTNPVTQGIFSSRTLRTDSSGSLQVVLTGTVTPTYPQAIPASTCAAPSLGESGAATTGIAFTATPSILMCIAGSAVSTITSSSITNTIRILNPDGSASAPSYSFLSDPDTGMYDLAPNQLGFATQGAERFRATTSTLLLTDAYILGWSDVSLSRFAAHVLALGANDVFRYQATGLTTTSTDGLLGINTTASTVGTPVQISPRSRLSGTGWDVDDAVSRTVSWFTENLPVSGNTVTSTFKIGNINAAGTTNYPATLDHNGNLILMTGGNYFWDTRGSFTALADGLYSVRNNAAAFGVQFNTGTAAPTVTSCGTGTVTSGSRNTAGEITATGATACTVTFGAPNWTNTPFCTITLANAPTTTPYISAISASAFTVSGLTAGDKFQFHCIGRI